jgi:hypothetical protein
MAVGMIPRYTRLRGVIQHSICAKPALSRRDRRWLLVLPTSWYSLKWLVELLMFFDSEELIEPSGCTFLASTPTSSVSFHSNTVHFCLDALFCFLAVFAYPVTFGLLLYLYKCPTT